MPLIRICSACGKKNRIPASRLSDTGRCGACGELLPPLSEPLEVDPALFEELIHNASVPVLVDFWAAWCPPCRMAAPEVARTATNMSGRAIVAKVDTESYPELAARFNVLGIPNFIVFKNGRPTLQQVGLADHAQMERWLSSNAESAQSPAES